MIVKIIVEWLALWGTGASEPVYLYWAGVGDGEAPTWAHGPGTPVCHSTSAINNGINPTKGKMINLNKNYLDTRACLWISQQRPLLGSDWYFLFFIPPCHCYLWSTQWGCHATQSVVPAVLWTALSPRGPHYTHLQISMKRPQTYLPEHYDYHSENLSSIQFCFPVYLL